MFIRQKRTTVHLRVIEKIRGITTGVVTEELYFYLYMAIGIYVKLQNVLIAVLCLEKNSQDKERIYYLFYELKNVRKKIKKSVNEILQ